MPHWTELFKNYFSSGSKHDLVHLASFKEPQSVVRVDMKILYHQTIKPFGTNSLGPAIRYTESVTSLGRGFTTIRLVQPC